MNKKLIDNYLKFCEYRQNAVDSNEINLANETWFYPTTLLPLINLISENKSGLEYAPPTNIAVARYLKTIMSGAVAYDSADTFCPIVQMPPEKEKTVSAMQHLYKLGDNGAKFGGEAAFKYILNELVDNIYEHSKFTEAFVMAQTYPKIKFIEICFFDNGITIPGSFNKTGKRVDDTTAIAEAINGESTKPGTERGYGLGSSIQLATKGLNGQVLIVSAGAAIQFNECQTPTVFDLTEQKRLNGTLVSVKIPFTDEQVDIYPYVEGRPSKVLK